MKNVHVLPTEKPSKGQLVKGKHLYFYKDGLSKEYLDIDEKFHHIYITNDSEIKEGDYYITNLDCKVLKCESVFRTLVYADGDYGRSLSRCKKIILTTDQDLIEDGVQAIDDEFLEWFVNNPTCESVEVYKNPFYEESNYEHYKIIIPQEEPEQLTDLEIAIKLEEIESEEREELENQTAIDWFAQQVNSSKWKFADMTDRQLIIDQAKEMEAEKDAKYNEMLEMLKCLIRVAQIEPDLYYEVRRLIKKSTNLKSK